MNKRLLAILTAGLLLLALPSCGASKPKTALLLDRDGNAFAEYDGGLTVYDKNFAAYARYALTEAADAVAEQKGCDTEKALTLLQSKGASIRTAADPALIAAAAGTDETLFDDTGTPFALAATDGNARLTAVYSTTGEITPTYAGSAIKPLSVYAPCVESGTMLWSSTQEDSPVKTVTTADGEEDWPVNGTGIYSYDQIPAAEALARSLNTVAVKWLQRYGAENAMDFLENSFGIDVSREREIAAQLSEDEVLGNLALGYLQNGVTVCGMAGYYRVFADEGRYTPAYAVLSVSSGSGKQLYTAAPEERQAMSAATAWIMNRMLKGVVDHGTGTAARIEGVDVVGKTGTSDDFADNWFIGVTAADTVAVWHGPSPSRGNRAAEAYNAFFQTADLPYDDAFTPCDEVVQAVYCTESGFRAGDNCPEIDLGYYPADRVPVLCPWH